MKKTNKAELFDLVTSINNYLNVSQINDYCPNGLQIEGSNKVGLIASAVTANQAVIDQAITLEASALLVHHGYFWRGEDPCITGIKYQRIKTLLAHNISLLAYHLPLDVHPEVGNNIKLAQLLELQDCKFLPNNIPVLIGTLKQACDIQHLAKNIRDKINPKIKVVDTARLITNVAICSGGGQNYFNDAIYAGADVFITGEATEHNFHSANEYGVNFIAAGHHATECFGIQALGEYISIKFDISHRFINCANPF